MIDKETIEARIKEHKTAAEQALAQANAHTGAVQALERLLSELEESRPKLGLVAS